LLPNLLIKKRPKSKKSACLQALSKAGDGTRTRDPLFTRQALYQLSYSGAVQRFYGRFPPFSAVTRVGAALKAEGRHVDANAVQPITRSEEGARRSAGSMRRGNAPIAGAPSPSRAVWPAEPAELPIGFVALAGFTVGMLVWPGFVYADMRATKKPPPGLLAERGLPRGRVM
jgi:hypothetical protein